MSLEASERPLVSFVLLAYNQERFIHEAVEGAFSQTYSPLEIILSDDCSLDGTFQVMARATKSYNGPHRIALRRNHKNAGISGHVNQLMEITKGELIVVGAGDDVSLPFRTERLHQRWERSGCPVGSIFSNVLEISEHGAVMSETRPAKTYSVNLRRILDGAQTPVIGSSHCWHRRVFSLGPLNDDVINEDTAIFFRSVLLGTVLHEPSVLVKHRVHGANLGAAGRHARMSSRDLLLYWQRLFAREATLLANLERDLMALAHVQGQNQQHLRLLRAVKRNRAFFLRTHRMFTSTGASRLLGVLSAAAWSPHMRMRWVIIKQLLAPGVYLGLKKAVLSMRHSP